MAEFIIQYIEPIMWVERDEREVYVYWFGMDLNLIPSTAATFRVSSSPNAPTVKSLILDASNPKT